MAYAYGPTVVLGGWRFLVSEVPLWRQEGTMEGMGGVLVNSAQVVGDLLKIAGSGTFTQVRPEPPLPGVHGQTFMVKPEP